MGEISPNEYKSSSLGALGEGGAAAVVSRLWSYRGSSSAAAAFSFPQVAVDDDEEEALRPLSPAPRNVGVGDAKPWWWWWELLLGNE